MLPHGPRPTTMPRRSRDAPSTAAARIVNQVAATDSGLGEAATDGPPVALREDVVTNAPVTTPAYAGWLPAPSAESATRRPFASITA